MNPLPQIVLEIWAKAKPYAIAFVAGLILGLIL